MTDPAAQQEQLDSSTSVLQTLREQTDALVATVRGLDDAALREPSLCDGWTRAHVVSHVSRNALAMLNLVRSVQGTPTPMYPSPQARDADIEEGSRHTHAQLLAELQDTAAQLQTALEGVSGAALTATATTGGGGQVTGADLPGHRLREVVWHHVDLDAGFGFADAPADAVKRWFDEEVEHLRTDPGTPAMTLRTDERDVVALGDGRPTVSGSRAGLLLWLVRDRADHVDAPAPDQLPHLNPDLEEDDK